MALSYRGNGLLQFCLAKSDRILRRSEFVKLGSIGRRIENECFLLIYSRSCGDRCRIGVTASRRVGRAVRRNRVKRLMREYFRLNRHQLSGKWDVNIIAKHKSSVVSAQEAFLCLKHLFAKVSASNDL